MREKKANTMIPAREAPVELVAELITTAEIELAAFYEAVLRQYGLKEAKVAALDWIREVEAMEWPLDGTPPHWRDVTIVAADCLASRVSTIPGACEAGGVEARNEGGLRPSRQICAKSSEI